MKKIKKSIFVLCVEAPLVTLSSDSHFKLGNLLLLYHPLILYSPCQRKLLNDHPGYFPSLFHGAAVNFYLLLGDKKVGKSLSVLSSVRPRVHRLKGKSQFVSGLSGRNLMQSIHSLRHLIGANSPHFRFFKLLKKLSIAA